MKQKDIIVTIILSCIVGILYFINQLNNTNNITASLAYQIYLNGEVIGIIKDEQELYDLINSEQ